MTPILVIGATGHVGRQVVSQLLANGIPVRALARNPANAGLPAEVEVTAGDLTEPATLDPSLDGVNSVFLVWNAPAEAVPAAIERIAQHARRIVFLSSPYQTAHPLFQAAQPNAVSRMHAAIEQQIQSSGLAWTFVRPGMFAVNARHWWGPQIRTADVVRWPYAQSPTAPIHEHDIAAVAVRALCDSRCDGADYMITGPASLTQAGQVSTIGDVLGLPLRLEEITPDEWRREVMPSMPPPVATMLLAAWAGAVGQPALVTSTVAEVTGTPARTFRDWATENAADFQTSPR